jgi:hypothetical protein
LKNITPNENTQAGGVVCFINENDEICIGVAVSLNSKTKNIFVHHLGYFMEVVTQRHPTSLTKIGTL